MSDPSGGSKPSVAPHPHVGRRPLLPLTLTALGVVYGDIGTSPLYALRECFFSSHSVPPTHENVLGVLSLIIYSLILVVSIKYIVLVMRADNQGEGGILALTALILRPQSSSRGRGLLILLGIVGASLLYGDGMITPAITVLGAVEGLKVVTPIFDNYVVPISIVILITVFAIQRYGTDRVGGFFGPIMVVWFATLAALGIASIAQAPEVLAAVNPVYAVEFFHHNGWHGFGVLGARLPCRHWRRGAVRGHGALRQAADPHRLVRVRASGAALELLRAGLARPAKPERRRAAVLPAGAGMDAAAARGAGHDGGDHRVAGPDLRCVLPDPRGDSARLRAAPRRRAHLASRDGSGLRAAGQLVPRPQHHHHRHRLPLVDARWPRPTASPWR